MQPCLSPSTWISLGHISELPVAFPACPQGALAGESACRQPVLADLELEALFLAMAVSGSPCSQGPVAVAMEDSVRLTLLGGGHGGATERCLCPQAAPFPLYTVMADSPLLCRPWEAAEPAPSGILDAPSASLPRRSWRGAALQQPERAGRQHSRAGWTGLRWGGPCTAAVARRECCRASTPSCCWGILGTVLKALQEPPASLGERGGLVLFCDQVPAATGPFSAWPSSLLLFLWQKASPSCVSCLAGQVCVG